MFELKTLSTEAIPAALVKAKQYRLLNEPNEAESICLDILAISPDHQEALATLLLALTDKFSDSGLEPSFEQARQILERLDTSHCKSYYAGIIYERRAKYHLRQGGPGSGAVAFDWLSKAMAGYHEAMNSCDPDNQDAVLRWNSCIRIMNAYPEVRPIEAESAEMLLDAFETPH